MDALVPARSPRTFITNSIHPAVHQQGQACSTLVDEAPSSNSAESRLESAIDDWLGPEMPAERRASIHLALHGVVSAPFLLLDNDFMTPDLVTSLPLAVWKALDKLAVEQGNGINSVCFPAGMAGCPAALSQLGALAYIELPAYGGETIDLRELVLDNPLHLSLSGTDSPVQVHVNKPTSIVVTGDKSTVTLNYHEENPNLQRIDFLRGQHSVQDNGSCSHNNEAAHAASCGPSAATTQKLDEHVVSPSQENRTAREKKARNILTTLRLVLDSEQSDDEKLRTLKTWHFGPLAKIVNAILARNEEVVDACLPFLASANVSDEFKSDTFRFLLKSLTESMGQPLHKNAGQQTACFIVGKMLELNMGSRMKFDLLNDQMTIGEGYLGLSSALRSGDARLIELILSALFQSALSTDDMVSLLTFHKIGNPLRAAVERGHVDAIKKFVDTVLAYPKFSGHERLRIFGNSKPPVFDYDLGDDWIPSRKAARARVTFAISVLHSNVAVSEIEFFLDLRPGSSMSTRGRPSYFFGKKNGWIKETAQAFHKIINIGELELIRQYVAAVFTSTLHDSQKVELIADARPEPDIDRSLIAGTERSAIGWSTFASELFFSALSDGIKVDIFKLCDQLWHPDFNYKEIFLRATDENHHCPDPGLTALREAIALWLGLPKNTEALGAESMDQLASDLSSILNYPYLDESLKFSLLESCLGKGLRLPKTCIVFTELILAANLPDHVKVGFFRGDVAASSGLAVPLQSTHHIISGYLNAVLDSTLAEEYKVVLLNRSDWTTSEDIVNMFAQRILYSNLDNESLTKIFLRQFQKSLHHKDTAGTPLLKIVMKSRLSNDQKFLVASAGGEPGPVLLRYKDTPASIRSYLKVILASPCTNQQKVALCESCSDTCPSFLNSLFMYIAGNNLHAHVADECKAKAQAFVETVLASSLPEALKFELLSARDKLGEAGIVCAEKAGAASTVEMFNQAILNSDLSEPVKRKLVRVGMCRTQ